jgi:xanthine dehydrogenase accessory factor
MKLDLLTALGQRIAQKRSCAWIVDTKGTAYAMVDADSAKGSLALTDSQLAEARRMMAADKSGFLADTSLFVRVYGVSPRLIVVGAVHIAQALVPMAMLAGFEVVVIDPRGAFLASGKIAGATTIEEWPDDGMAKAKPDARTAVVTLTHDPKLDDPALAAALRSPAFYIGALGSRKTHAKRLQRLKGDGFDDAALARIHGPVGLDINAVSPAEIAVSIVAQLVATLRADAK